MHHVRRNGQAFPHAPCLNPTCNHRRHLPSVSTWSLQVWSLQRAEERAATSFSPGLAVRFCKTEAGIVVTVRGSCECKLHSTFIRGEVARTRFLLGKCGIQRWDPTLGTLVLRAQGYMANESGHPTVALTPPWTEFNQELRAHSGSSSMQGMRCAIWRFPGPGRQWKISNVKK